MVEKLDFWKREDPGNPQEKTAETDVKENVGDIVVYFYVTVH